MHSANRPKKLPKNYQLVLEVVSAQPPGLHAAASEIYALARRRRAGIGCSTVYRALDRLCEAGLVHAVRVPGNGSALYEAARDGHAHFRCTTCGSVEDIDYDIPTGDIAGLSHHLGIAIADVSLTFSGVCRICRRAPRT